MNKITIVNYAINLNIQMIKFNKNSATYAMLKY